MTDQNTERQVTEVQRRQTAELQARAMNFTGDACHECGNFTTVRTGTCLSCVSCGATSGCS